MVNKIKHANLNSFKTPNSQVLTSRQWGKRYVKISENTCKVSRKLRRRRNKKTSQKLSSWHLWETRQQSSSKACKGISNPSGLNTYLPMNMKIKGNWKLEHNISTKASRA